MKIFNNVRGSQTTVPQVEVNVDTVYIRSNIRRIETEDFTGWEYDEVQHNLRDYIGKITPVESDINIAADTVVFALMDIQDMADMLMLALEKIEELEGKING